MAAPIHVVVNGLGGPRCTVEATPEWPIRKVHEGIHKQIDVPVLWQTLLKDTAKLDWEVTVASLMSDELEKTLQLSLVVNEVAPEEGALRDAIARKDEAAAMHLLQLPQLPDLDVRDRDPMLQNALFAELPNVALGILKRPDFSGVNNTIDLHFMERRYTALHVAAQKGFLSVCKAIVARADFTELHARTWDVDNCPEDTASQLAHKYGHNEVAMFLATKEAVRNNQFLKELQNERKGKVLRPLPCPLPVGPFFPDAYAAASAAGTDTAAFGYYPAGGFTPQQQQQVAWAQYASAMHYHQQQYYQLPQMHYGGHYGDVWPPASPSLF